MIAVLLAEKLYQKLLRNPGQDRVFLSKLLPWVFMDHGARKKWMSLTGAGNDFSSELCIGWEDSSKQIEDFGVRRVIIRTGIVLDKKGGILQQMALPVKLFVGGRMGTGKQGIPWIHIEDEVNAIIFLIMNDSARGVFNLSAPRPVSNAEFMKRIATVLRRPYWFHIPEFAIKLLLGEMSTLLLNGQFMVPRKLVNLGFNFKYVTIEQALDDLFKHH